MSKRKNRKVGENRKLRRIEKIHLSSKKLRDERDLLLAIGTKIKTR